MSWELVLKEMPNTVHVATDELKDTVIQEVKNQKRKPRTITRDMNKIVAFDWEKSGYPEEEWMLFVQRAKEILTKIKELGAYNIDTEARMKEHVLNELTEKYMKGDHDGLERWVDGEGLGKTEKYARKGRFRTFVDKMGLRQDMESYITSNNLQSTLTGKALKSKLPVQEEPKITRSDITPDKAVAFLKFIITDNQFVGKQRKQLFPQTFENKPLDSIAGRSTIRLLPALSYILDNDSFDMEKADFTIEVSGQTQQNMALRRLKFNQLRDREKRKKPEEKPELTGENLSQAEGMSSTLATDVPQRLKDLFDKNVTVQYKSQKRGDIGQKEFGRARGIEDFLQALADDRDKDGMSGPDRQAWLNWLKTFDVKGKYKLSDDDYEALQKWNSVHNSLDEVTIEQKIEAENELDEYLQGNPIGSLDDISDVEEFFKDADKRKAFSEMKVVPDGSRRATPSSKPMLEELFYQSGKPTDLIRNKYGGKTELESEKKLKELYHLLRDEQYDSNKLRIEDVIELLREIEYEYKGSAKLNMVVSSMRQAQLEEEDTRFDTVWDKGIHILLKGVEDNYVGIRKSFLNAIKDVMVEESKKEDVPTVTWMRSQKVITDGE